LVEPPAPPPEGPEPVPPPGGSPPPVEWSEIGRKVTAARGEDLTLLVASAVFLVATFLPWYRYTFGRLSASDTAWGSGGLAVFAALLGIGVGVVAVLATSGSKNMGPQSAGLLALLLSALALLFTFLRFVIRPPDAEAIERQFRGLVDISRGIGLWLALAAAIAMTIASYRKYRQSAV
jgi:hypothetical protein